MVPDRNPLTEGDSVFSGSARAVGADGAASPGAPQLAGAATSRDARAVGRAFLAGLGFRGWVLHGDIEALGWRLILKTRGACDG